MTEISTLYRKHDFFGLLIRERRGVATYDSNQQIVAAIVSKRAF